MAACTDVGGRGCPCSDHAASRIYQREYAARKRRAKLDARRMSATSCPRRFGRHGVCGAVLESDVIGGRIVVSCWACDRMARGICRDCPRPVEGQVRKARRCAIHKAASLIVSCRKHDINNKDERRAASRRNYQKNDARRLRKNEYKKAWRKANPEKVRAYKRAEVERALPSRAEYFVAYRAAHRRKNRTREALRAKDALPLRTCTTPRCSIVVTGRKKKCTKCRERDRAAGVAQLAPTKGRGFRTDLRGAA